MNISVLELAEMVTARLLPGDNDTMITGFASLREARRGDLSFFSDHRYRGWLAETKASAVLIPEGWTTLPPHVSGLIVKDPSVAFEKIVDAFGFHATPATVGIHPSAVVAEGIITDQTGVSIGANAVVEEGTQLGNHVSIGAGSYVGRNVTIGDNTQLFPNATIQEGCTLGARVILHSGVVIGADGFGYEFINGEHRKVRQSGIVQIDDDVEIGANTTIDRARFGRTWIGKGTKIDNLVQIAHNVVIGKHCIIVSGTGIAGSAQIGDYVVIAAQAGIAGHVNVGSMVTIGGRAGVTKDLPPGRESYMGFPATTAGEERRRVAASRRLPDLLDRVRELERANRNLEIKAIV
ncbi:UDP-3-O-(3-hydroxymyristoyl)glucosamine N-acyltransferase [Phragmitibacter flavus]|uniref:UDP-3-O-acylglucosamine N-acyltransferase n=1 Tax=Phragmitibacter flavus TaxID=2576071 RepID=A0A5R8KA11_9BACT|nr:UDP-3-O-(3-hydroxymyristoyl)glucosamine N-acyltransferase [Phragmitibacter flavus]TLD68745.1 UDP-3-O-(3-hydroxymyristoyl)glucosamine N-acyltransferase [Phragmitibacter flavus]